MPDSTPLTMTIPEFAELAKVSRGLAYDLARRDELPVPVIRFGRRLVVSRKAVETLLNGGGQEHDGQ